MQTVVFGVKVSYLIRTACTLSLLKMVSYLTQEAVLFYFNKIGFMCSNPCMTFGVDKCLWKRQKIIWFLIM